MAKERKMCEHANPKILLQVALLQGKELQLLGASVPLSTPEEMRYDIIKLLPPSLYSHRGPIILTATSYCEDCGCLGRGEPAAVGMILPLSKGEGQELVEIDTDLELLLAEALVDEFGTHLEAAKIAHSLADKIAFLELSRRFPNSDTLH